MRTSFIAFLLLFTSLSHAHLADCGKTISRNGVTLTYKGIDENQYKLVFNEEDLAWKKGILISLSMVTPQKFFSLKLNNVRTASRYAPPVVTFDLNFNENRIPTGDLKWIKTDPRQYRNAILHNLDATEGVRVICALEKSSIGAGPRPWAGVGN